MYNDILSYYVLCTKAHAFLNTGNGNCVKTLNSNRFHFHAKKAFIIKSVELMGLTKEKNICRLYQVNSVPSTSALKPESENYYFSVKIVSAIIAYILQGNYSNYYCVKNNCMGALTHQLTFGNCTGNSTLSF